MREQAWSGKRLHQQLQLTLRGRHVSQLTLLRRTLVAGMPEVFGDEICDMMLRLMQHRGCSRVLPQVGLLVCCWHPGMLDITPIVDQACVSAQTRELCQS